jgi:carbamoyltransferase
MPYNILAINPGHNGSACLLVDGEVVYYAEEERLSRMKYDGNPFRAMLECLQSYPVDELILGGTSPEFSKLPWTMEDAYTALVRKFNPKVLVTNMGHQHHLGHAAGAFYNSGFDEALAVIVDGAGSFHSTTTGPDGTGNTVGGYETESVYKCSYPVNFEPLYKRYSDGRTDYFNNGVQEFDNSVTITKAYEAVSHYLGFGYIEAGKTMGLAPYGKANATIPDFFVEGKGNKNLLLPMYPAGSNIDENRFPALQRTQEPKEWHNNFSKVKDIDRDLAWKIQQESQQMVCGLIESAVASTGIKNVVIAGGYGLNCVANYYYKDRLKDINLYVDPISHDGGTAMGLAKLGWYVYNNTAPKNPLKHIYLGAAPNYSILDNILKQISGIKTQSADINDVADLLVNGNIVSLFHGRPEGGPRALGNRSILFDPRRPDGKDFVNRVKGREWFRPFAASVMEEHADEWFEMRGLKSSPFMMYAINLSAKHIGDVPSVTHVDGTCRVQTVNEADNLFYYRLIDAFYKKTGVPMVFNTSFNLAGDPLVETLVDAVNTIIGSDIKYLYLPDIGKLLVKE